MCNPLIVLGSTGLLGQALRREARRRRVPALAVARHETQGLAFDVTDELALKTMFERARPEVVINAAANTRLDDIERRPSDGYLVNTRLPAQLARLCEQHGTKLVQISTDHYFVGRENTLHDEYSAVTLVNEYARGKFAAEALAATCPGALVVRTNIVGLRGWGGQPTFAEWAIDQLKSGRPFPAFTDMWTSSIDVDSFAAAVFDLVDRDASGVLNVASRQSSSKYEFIRSLAGAIGADAALAQASSVAALAGTPRANALGLDVSRAEQLLGRRLPDLAQVTQALSAQFQEKTHAST